MDIGALRNRIAFLDVEASGLMQGSFPVEVAWIAGDVRGEVLVDPSGHWNESRWDPDAEAMHGISLAEARSKGRSPVIAAARLSEAMKDRVAFTDSPEHDAAWLDMLHEAAGIPRQYRIESVGRLLGHMGVKAEESFGIFARARETHPPRGRARAGAAHLEEVFRIAGGRP